MKKEEKQSSKNFSDSCLSLDLQLNSSKNRFKDDPNCNLQTLTGNRLQSSRSFCSRRRKAEQESAHRSYRLQFELQRRHSHLKEMQGRRSSSAPSCHAAPFSCWHNHPCSCGVTCTEIQPALAQQCKRFVPAPAPSPAQNHHMAPQTLVPARGERKRQEQQEQLEPDDRNASRGSTVSRDYENMAKTSYL